MQDPLINLREEIALGAIEVAIINEEQFAIKRKDVNIIEIVAIIPTLVDNLRVRLSDHSLDVCSIDGYHKIVKRDGSNLIEILSDIVSIDRAVTTDEPISNNSKEELTNTSEPSASTFTIKNVKSETLAMLSAESSALNRENQSNPLKNELCRYFKIVR